MPRVLVARLNPDLTLDPTFGGPDALSETGHAGYHITHLALYKADDNMPAYGSFLRPGFAVQPDGKILLGASHRDGHGPDQYLWAAACRLNADGTIDTTFDDPGDGFPRREGDPASGYPDPADGYVVLNTPSDHPFPEDPGFT